MAFRTNKVPAIEERTVSGSSVSFHSNFALPLKACKVSFEATQSGSGDPSPSNPRAISGVSAIGLTANSTPVSVSLGEERFGGELDVLNGILNVTFFYFKITTVTGVIDAQTARVNLATLRYPTASGYYKYQNPFKCNIFKSADYSTIYDDRIYFVNTSAFTILSSSEIGTSISDWEDFFDDNPCYMAYKMATPITIQLSANELSSIIGNNTFSTDKGTLEITFADLQEKSASGSVASFNTALAMPLVSCNIAVNAWQEGSGDPSPSNVRPIHGFSEVNVTANNVVRTIQLGQEVYGAEVDVVNGVAHCTWIKKVITELLSNTGWSWYNPYKQFYNSIYMLNRPAVASDVTYLKCETLKPITIATDREANIGNFSGIVSAGTGIAFSAPNVNSLDDAKAWVIDNPITFIYELAEPFDIQLTPTQIETLIGNNTIFADTGDVDLTYNDLDIAKRGSFREVFKLP